MTDYKPIIILAILLLSLLLTAGCDSHGNLAVPNIKVQPISVNMQPQQYSYQTPAPVTNQSNVTPTVAPTETPFSQYTFTYV